MLHLKTMNDEDIDWDIIEGSEDGVLEFEDEEDVVKVEQTKSDNTLRIECGNILKRLDIIEKEFRKLVMKLKMASVEMQARAREGSSLTQEDTKKPPNIFKKMCIPALPNDVPTAGYKKLRYDFDLSLLAVSK